MKKIFKWVFVIPMVIAGVALFSHSAHAEIKSEFTAGPSVSYIKYEEPGIMEETGMMYGGFADYKARFTNGVVAGLNGDFNFGQLDYDSNGTGSVDNIDNFLGEARGTLGYNFLAVDQNELTIYAGFGYRYLLDKLGGIAPVTAIRGNVDRGELAFKLRAHETVEIRSHLFYIVHDLGDLDLDPKAAKLSVVISGHTHKPSIEKQDGVLYLNPGSAGPRRFQLPASVAIVEISENSLDARLISLDV